jgi:hypothetical protein
MSVYVGEGDREGGRRVSVYPGTPGIIVSNLSEREERERD